MIARSLLIATALTAATVATAANAATTIVNLSATGASANGGPVTQTNGGPTANPVVLALTAGTYSVSLIGTANGGAYDAYSVATPANGNYTLQYSGYSIGGVATLLQPVSPGRYSTAAAALAAYQAGPGLANFTLTQTTNVSFYIEDAASLYFADDTGGVSFAVTQVSAAVPEPATWGMMIAGFGLMGGVMRRRKTTVAFAA